MKLILSNYGHRMISRAAQAPLGEGPGQRLVRALLDHLSAPSTFDALEERLVARGIVQRVPASMADEEIALRYQRNPLENVRRLVFEYTTLCNLSCVHCRNGPAEPVSERRADPLMQAVDAMIPLGVRRFDFIGGEVTMYGLGWLDVVEHIAAYGEHVASVITSGWWLGQENFKAAGARYADDRAYLRALKSRGLTHVIFSLDGPRAQHDAWRQVPGLYDRIMAGFSKVHEAGLSPKVSVVFSEQLKQQGEEVNHDWMQSLAEQLYTFDIKVEATERIARMLNDPLNYFSNFIDVGNAVQLRRGVHHIDDIDDASLRCKNFFRPSPSLRIRADGELSLCPLLDAAEGYGNVSERGLIPVLNSMQDAMVYKLHAERRIAGYRKHLDREIFGDRLDHVCTMRTVLTMLARGIEEQGIAEEDREAIRRLNIDVAQRAGLLPKIGRKALGLAPPR